MLFKISSWLSSFKCQRWFYLSETVLTNQHTAPMMHCRWHHITFSDVRFSKASEIQTQTTDTSSFSVKLQNINHEPLSFSLAFNYSSQMNELYSVTTTNTQHNTSIHTFTRARDLLWGHTTAVQYLIFFTASKRFMMSDSWYQPCHTIDLMEISPSFSEWSHRSQQVSLSFSLTSAPVKLLNEPPAWREYSTPIGSFTPVISFHFTLRIIKANLSRVCSYGEYRNWRKQQRSKWFHTQRDHKEEKYL